MTKHADGGREGRREATREIAEAFDARVMTDLAERSRGRRPQTCYYIGTPHEMSAGFYAQDFTPHFFTLDALERYCRRNRRRLLREAAHVS